MRAEPASDGRGPGFSATFAPGLTDPLAPVPADVTARHGKGVKARYNVYRNNVVVSLIDALAATYPAVQRITGTEFFRAMARFHVRATPPSSPLLFEYGHDFPSFIEGYEYAWQMPWLADVARIERAWLDAYHAADAPVLSQDVFASVEPSLLGTLRFASHPAARIVRSAYPAVALFVMNRRDEPATPLCSNEREDALVTRPEQAVIVSRLPPGGAVFLRDLIAGNSLSGAVTAAFNETASFDLQTNLAGMISAGVFTAAKPGD